MWMSVGDKCGTKSTRSVSMYEMYDMYEMHHALLCIVFSVGTTILEKDQEFFRRTYLPLIDYNNAKRDAERDTAAAAEGKRAALLKAHLMNLRDTQKAAHCIGVLDTLIAAGETAEQHLKGEIQFMRWV